MLMNKDHEWPKLPNQCLRDSNFGRHRKLGIVVRQARKLSVTKQAIESACRYKERMLIKLWYQKGAIYCSYSL